MSICYNIPFLMGINKDGYKYRYMYMYSVKMGNFLKI